MTLRSADLRKYGYFSGLSGESLEALSEKLTVAEFPAGMMIVAEGEVGDSFYFVKQRKRADFQERIKSVRVIGTAPPLVKAIHYINSIPEKSPDQQRFYETGLAGRAGRHDHHGIRGTGIYVEDEANR